MNSANLMILLFMVLGQCGGFISPNINSLSVSSIFERIRKSGFLPWLWPSNKRLSFELSDSPLAQTNESSVLLNISSSI
ncbi:hypothetical protein GLOIN_2v1495159 [Rhizophagus irregularis DAOM 181602=DAOM 197198]|uniref:Secreted protein n=1 Tax=Rhizophagus irregularis (strain DAOM 181602 / DAOM 197198 / MUCL 43194) TaxID=747089 RepID=A0A2P4QXY0_RHIID|nr:hypothetical protein GLOIN_2v1495159 [Rhizophagus irregularis DAOM 181602=DAOM 197198]POG82462.1 hypothetical protein GLOIN_2v1495159 [Rhizophagus irregularis DAOM 181602=DAOM 197198]|eukprot:XP_025189328.1 hypothetical protein GLOIN_2v1495159 [Rhizophagus irregularis DAOM 181602=DAOM 197198]